MKVAVTEIFCEIISGLALALLVLAFLDWQEIYVFEKLWEAVKPALGLTLFTIILVGAYLLGVVLDAVGLVFDELFDNRICSDEPTSQEMKLFWNKAGEHVFEYRDNVWAYYFCYRNLFILVLPSMICWFGALRHRGLFGWAWSVAVTIFLMGIVLFVSMRILLKLYYEITKSF